MEQRAFGNRWIDFERLYRRDEYRCAYCGADCGRDLDSYHQLEIDHVVPQSSGAGDAIWQEANMVVSCSVCNRMKGPYFSQKTTTHEQIQEARRFVSVKRRIAQEYYIARVLARRGRATDTIRLPANGQDTGPPPQIMVRDELLEPLQQELGDEYTCVAYHRSKSVSWMEIHNTSDRFYFYLGVDADLGLTLQLDTVSAAWKDRRPIELIASAPPEELTTVQQMTALVWAGFDPANSWSRIGPPVFSIPEAVLWAVGAIRDVDALLRRMPCIVETAKSVE